MGGGAYFLQSDFPPISNSCSVFSLHTGSLGVRVLRIFRVLSAGRGGSLPLVVCFFDPCSPEQDEGGDGEHPDGDDEGDDDGDVDLVGAAS